MTSPTMNRIRSRLRTLLKIRRKRRLAPVGPKPSIGSRIVADDLRMSVQAGMSDDLWMWLIGRGWREVTYRPDRRRYRDVPGSWVARLYEAAPADRGRVLLAAKAAARDATAAVDSPLAESRDFA